MYYILSIVVPIILVNIDVMSLGMGCCLWAVLWSLHDLFRGTRWQYMLPLGASAALLLVHWIL